MRRGTLSRTTFSSAAPRPATASFTSTTRRASGWRSTGTTPGAMPRDRRAPEASRRGDAMAEFDLIVRSGRVIDPASDIDGVHDVAVQAGRIAQVAPRIAGAATRTVDA